MDGSLHWIERETMAMYTKPATEARAKKWSGSEDSDFWTYCVA